MLPHRAPARLRPSPAYPQSGAGSHVKLVILVAAIVGAIALFSSFGGKGKGLPDANPQRQSNGGTVMLSDVLAVGLGLSEQAAAVIKQVKRQHQENMNVKGKTAEGVDEPVTDADKQSNAIFVNGYRNHFPGIRMLSEETDPADDNNIRSAFTLSPPLPPGADVPLDLMDTEVLIDPLDATKEFTEDLLEYVTTMVCVVHKGRPVAGIINQVFEDSPAVVGIVGSEDGTTGVLRGRDQRKTATGDAETTVAISRSHTGAGEDVVTKRFPGHRPLLAGGAGYKALLVLDGTANAYVHVTKIKAWDVCAADAVLHAIGGGFTDVDGKRLKYLAEDPVFKRGVVATQSKVSQAWYLEHLGGNMT
ncbi:hypothetical protein JKP88DRAFT_200945 [Tribonema minus]|uniref:inositol-phosphate phosphatase n=1 Tax=Tribonema minus TaxID=303371 RepID=A0A835YRT6_9STRA|nr:hypothetical protein JKP88DRAFT_200945 [Tribonema minus]